MRVAVVGGGAIGLACAHRLVRGGADVVVLEAGRFGEGASFGNAGWVTPLLSTPVPGPGVLTKALRWMLDPKSPLLVRPRPDPSFAAWCWRFARSCTRPRFEAGTRALLALNARTLALFDELREDGVDFEMHASGVIAAALSERALREEWELVEDVRRLGYPEPLELLDRDDVHRLEPSLGPGVVGGVFAPAERHVRPESLTAGLVRRLRDAGADLRERSPVTGLSRAGGGWSLAAGGAPVTAERVVLAAGVATRRLLAPLGVRIPLEGAKGYSVTTGEVAGGPRHAVMLLEAKVGCSPFEGSLRLAGTLELPGESLRLNRRRLGAIVEAAARYFAAPPQPATLEWAGLRPLLPDGLPAIGRVPGADGVFAATGHSMLGITLAPATAAALAPLVLEDRVAPELAPFALDRF